MQINDDGNNVISNLPYSLETEKNTQFSKKLLLLNFSLNNNESAK